MVRKYRRRKALQSPHAHPLVNWMFREMHKQQIDILDLAERAGIGKHTPLDWVRKRNPGINNFDAALGVLGYRLVAVRKRGDDR